jgi:hypothetical protein
VAVAAAQCGCAVGSHTLGARRRRPKYKSAALRYVYDADVNAAAGTRSLGCVGLGRYAYGRRHHVTRSRSEASTRRVAAAAEVVGTHTFVTHRRPK